MVAIKTALNKRATRAFRVAHFPLDSPLAGDGREIVKVL